MAEGDFDWGSLLANLVSGVNIPIGSAPDRSSSNQDVTFQYGENLPYLEQMLGREMYGSGWNPPAAAGAPSPGAPPPGATPPVTTPTGTPPPAQPITGDNYQSGTGVLGSSGFQPGFQWDLTPGAGKDGSVPLPKDPMIPSDQPLPLPTDPQNDTVRLPWRTERNRYPNYVSNYGPDPRERY
jgi:hypothetical protein